MCLASIYWARIPNVYYANTRKDAKNIGFDDDFIYQEIPKNIADRSIPTAQICHSEALDVFKMWADKKDKIEY